MQYYASWTHSDPIYHVHIPRVGILVSHPYVNQKWTIDSWPTKPHELMLDSGSYQYAKKQYYPDPAVILARQLFMIGQCQTPAKICHLDIPMLGTTSHVELDRRFQQNLLNAQWLMQQRNSIPSSVELIGVIQGYSVERIFTAAQVLASMGYQSFAIGSLAHMVSNRRDELLRRVEAVLEAVGTNVHVLGVSSMTILDSLARIGIASVDSGTAIHEAWRGGILYSNPLRRYKIASPYFQEWRRTYSFAELLDEPLSCACPICRDDPTNIMHIQGKQWVNLRAIHNCYHLAQEFMP